MTKNDECVVLYVSYIGYLDNEKENLTIRTDANLLRTDLMNMNCIELSFSYVTTLNHLNTVIAYNLCYIYHLRTD